MQGSPTLWQRYRRRILSGLVGPALLGLGNPLAVQAEHAVPAPPLAETSAPAHPLLVLDLAACRKLALEKQPGLAAYRASLAAAQAKCQSLDSLRVPVCLRPDLPIRRHQAAQALLAAQAQLCQAEWDTRYAATRLYWTVVYAQVQGQFADSLPAPLTRLRDRVKRIGNPPNEGRPERPDVTPNRFKQLESLLHLVESQRADARWSGERARAALREAIGLCEGPLQVGSGSLDFPPPAEPVCREQIVSLALARRGEITQAAVGVEVTGLEVQAQGKSHKATFPTFASGSDLHAQPVPLTEADGFYRPGGVALEMPANLVGPRCGRVDQAQAFSGRAVAVQDKVKQLIALQAEDAFCKYQIARQQSQELQQAARAAEEASSEVTAEFEKHNRVERNAEHNLRDEVLPMLTEVIQARMQTVQLRAQANEARLRLVLALAELERVTAGGFCPGFDGPPAGLAPPAPSSP
jgi:hypothetical protein